MITLFNMHHPLTTTKINDLCNPSEKYKQEMFHPPLYYIPYANTYLYDYQ